MARSRFAGGLQAHRHDPQGTTNIDATGAATYPGAKGVVTTPCVHCRGAVRWCEAMVAFGLAGPTCCASGFSAASGEERAEARGSGELIEVKLLS